MKVFQQLVVVVFCVLVFNAAFAQDEIDYLVIMVTKEPAGSDENTDVYIDQLITEPDQEAGRSNLPAGFAGGNAHDMSDVVTERGLLVDESRPYLHMRVRTGDQGSAVDIKCCVDSQ